MMWLKLLGISSFLIAVMGCKKNKFNDGFFLVQDIIIFPNGQQDTLNYKSAGSEYKKNNFLFKSDSSELVYVNSFDLDSKTSSSYFVNDPNNTNFSILNFTRSNNQLIIEREEKSGIYKSYITFNYIE